MEPVVHISKNYKEAEEYDIQQHIHMTSAERQAAAKLLKERFFGNNMPDVRASYIK